MDRTETITRHPLKPNRKLRELIWLTWSLFFWIEPIQHNQLRGWILFAASYAAFLLLYCLRIFSSSRKVEIFVLVSWSLLGIFCTPNNYGYLGMQIYVAAFLPFVVTKKQYALPLLLVPSGIMMVQGNYLHISPWSWGICSALSLMTGLSNVMNQQQSQSMRQLSMANEEIEQLARIAERERIARDLHDLLGHTLSVIVLKSELAGKMMDRDPERSRKEIQEVEQTARKALMEVREAVLGYRSDGLKAELKRAHSALSNMGVQLHLPAQIPELPAEQESLLSILIRESVTNILRHAQATHCHIELDTDTRATRLTIQDDGCGGVFREGNGLRGMRERLESMGGRLRIESTDGTTLHIEVPAASQEAA